MPDLLRLILCIRCGIPRELIDTVNADYTGSDPGCIQFAEMAALRGQEGTWQVYECQNPDCGCGCRAYIGLPEN